MRREAIAAGVLALVGAGGVFWAVRGRAVENTESGAKAVRQKVVLTVYRNDFGMVQETRPVALTAGENRLHIGEVSRQLDPQSVLLDWAGGAPNAPQLVAHAYDLGVADSDTLLRRYLGQEVEVVRYGENGREAERQRGRLMVQHGGEFVLQEGDRFHINPQGEIIAPTSPDIVTIPQLSVQAQSQAAQNADLNVTYLTRGLSWSADYVATLDPARDTLKLDCWATVVNQTGANYPNAQVTLLAGAPNRAVRPAEARARLDEDSSLRGYEYARKSRLERNVPAMQAAVTAGFGGRAPEAVGEGQAYRIQNATTVVQEQLNRLLMLSSAKVGVVRDYNAQPPILTAWGGYEYGWGTPAQPGRGSVQVGLSFFNRERDGLGVPLPAGAIRLYEPDAQGALRYVGAGNIVDTPKEQKIGLTLARAFDVFTEWRLVQTEKIDKKTVRKQVELRLHNEKAVAVELRLVQTFAGRWKMVREDAPHTGLDASRVQWKVTVPPGGNIPFRYTVDLLY